MAGALRVGWGVLLAGLLAGVLLLGFAATRGAVEPGLHVMASIAVVGLAIASHARRGGGGDLLAVALLLAAAGLGTFAAAGSLVAALHLAAAVLAVLLSAGLHLLGGSADRLPMAGETRG